MLGKANELKVVHVTAHHLKEQINRTLKELGDAEVLDIKFHGDKALIIYKES